MYAHVHIECQVVKLLVMEAVIEGVDCTFCTLSGHSSLEMGEDSMADRMAK